MCLWTLALSCLPSPWEAVPRTARIPFPVHMGESSGGRAFQGCLAFFFQTLMFMVHEPVRIWQLHTGSLACTGACGRSLVTLVSRPYRRRQTPLSRASRALRVAGRLRNLRRGFVGASQCARGDPPSGSESVCLMAGRPPPPPQQRDHLRS